MFAIRRILWGALVGSALMLVNALGATPVAVAHSETCSRVAGVTTEHGSVTAQDLIVRRDPGPMPAGDPGPDHVGWLVGGDTVTRVGMYRCLDETGRHGSSYLEVLANARAVPAASSPANRPVKAFVITGWTTVG